MYNRRKQPVEDLRIKLNRMREERGYLEGLDPPPDPSYNQLRDSSRDDRYYRNRGRGRGYHPNRRGARNHYDPESQQRRQEANKDLKYQCELNKGKPVNIRVELQRDSGQKTYSIDENETFAYKSTRGTRVYSRGRNYNNIGDRDVHGSERGRGRGRGNYRGRTMRRGRGRGGTLGAKLPHNSKDNNEEKKEEESKNEAKKDIEDTNAEQQQDNSVEQVKAPEHVDSEGHEGDYHEGEYHEDEYYDDYAAQEEYNELDYHEDGTEYYEGQEEINPESDNIEATSSSNTKLAEIAEVKKENDNKVNNLPEKGKEAKEVTNVEKEKDLKVEPVNTVENEEKKESKVDVKVEVKDNKVENEKVNEIEEKKATKEDVKGDVKDAEVKQVKENDKIIEPKADMKGQNSDKKEVEKSNELKAQDKS